MIAPQFHQLRGRIGRSEKASTCLLLYQSPLGDIARRRLRILRETEDGFRIDEEDLRLRGAGEVLGTRQSGLPTLRLADLAIHEELVAIAHDDARLVLERDPHLESERGQALRTLLYLFRRDEAVQYLTRRLKSRGDCFEAATKQEAESLAESWIRSHPGCRVIESAATATGRWRLVFEYDDKPRPN
jgi:hypothetical protein